MGMFSVRCLGCDTDLREGEYVIMDGHRQIYDGYGGTAKDIDRPGPCWHVFCYDRIPFSERRTEDSPYAQNQGFGYDRLQYLEAYDEDRKVKYFPMLEILLQKRSKGEGLAASETHNLYLIDNKGRMRLRDERVWALRRNRLEDRIFEKLITINAPYGSRDYRFVQDLLIDAIYDKAGPDPTEAARRFLWDDHAFLAMYNRLRFLFRQRGIEDGEDLWLSLYVFGEQYTTEGKRIQGQVFESRRITHKEMESVHDHYLRPTDLLKHWRLDESKGYD